MPTAPHTSGTSRRPRLRISNDNSIATNGPATSTGTSQTQPATMIATATAAASTTVSTIAIRSARRDRSSQRPRRMSTATSLAGVRNKNAVNAAIPNATPAVDHATSRPSNTGSRVNPQPPCSLGIATARHPTSSPTSRSAWIADITPPPVVRLRPVSTATPGPALCAPESTPHAAHTDSLTGTADPRRHNARDRWHRPLPRSLAARSHRRPRPDFGSRPSARGRTAPNRPAREGRAPAARTSLWSPSSRQVPMP